MKQYLELYQQVSDCMTAILVPIAEVPTSILRMGIWREHKKYEKAMAEMGMAPKGKIIRSEVVTLEDAQYTKLWMEHERQISFRVLPQESKNEG